MTAELAILITGLVIAIRGSMELIAILKIVPIAALGKTTVSAIKKKENVFARTDMKAPTVLLNPARITVQETVYV